MTEPEQPKPKITHLETKLVRDLLIMAVPDPWCDIDNDDLIRARCEQEVTLMLLAGPPIMREMSGGYKPRPHIVGTVREFDVRLVRKAEDLDGITVEHPDCTDCTDSIQLLQKDMAAGTVAFPIMAVVQFSYTEVVGAS
jgi:hypothetical protein